MSTHPISIVAATIFPQRQVVNQYRWFIHKARCNLKIAHKVAIALTTGPTRPAMTSEVAAHGTVNFGLASHYATSAGSATVYREEKFSELALVRQP